MAHEATKKLTSKEDWYKGKNTESSKSEEIMMLRTGSHNIRRKGMRRQMRQSVPKKEYEPAAVLFIRRTPGGTLVNQLRKEDEKLWPVLGHRMKLVERCGIKLKSLLWKADPWGGITCTDTKCPFCLEEGDRTIYKVNNAIYKNTCKEC